MARSPSSSPVNTYDDQEGSELLLQLNTRPITDEQLVNEVKGVFESRLRPLPTSLDPHRRSSDL
jgi:hypothetical protein